MTDYLSLKWGTIKGCCITKHSEAQEAAWAKLVELELPVGMSRARLTPEHKAALCELIDAFEGRIDNDWSGEEMTKEQAKAYVMEYRT